MEHHTCKKYFALKTRNIHINLFFLRRRNIFLLLKRILYFQMNKLEANQPQGYHVIITASSALILYKVFSFLIVGKTLPQRRQC